jgi:hypothetical protein
MKFCRGDISEVNARIYVSGVTVNCGRVYVTCIYQIKALFFEACVKATAPTKKAHYFIHLYSGLLSNDKNI